MLFPVLLVMVNDFSRIWESEGGASWDVVEIQEVQMDVSQNLWV
jgi:hypothetical protein